MSSAWWGRSSLKRWTKGAWAGLTSAKWAPAGQDANRQLAQAMSACALERHPLSVRMACGDQNLERRSKTACVARGFVVENASHGARLATFDVSTQRRRGRPCRARFGAEHFSNGPRPRATPRSRSLRDDINVAVPVSATDSGSRNALGSLAAPAADENPLGFAMRVLVVRVNRSTRA